MARLHPSRLVAVEADARLAAHLEARLADPRVAVVADGFVEASLAGPFDLACSAAAFHWLDPVPAFAKLRRLLRPGATLALWWNSYRPPGAADLADATVPLLAHVPLAPSADIRRASFRENLCSTVLVTVGAVSFTKKTLINNKT